jgi:hypothetical protein
VEFDGPDGAGGEVGPKSKARSSGDGGGVIGSKG